jgi:hypothetical protein
LAEKEPNSCVGPHKSQGRDETASIIRERNLLKRTQETLDLRPPKDHIEGNKIVLDGQGHFPKIIIIIEPGRNREYRIIKTQKGNYLLN